MLDSCKFPGDDPKEIEMCRSLSGLYVQAFILIPVHLLVSFFKNLVSNVVCI